MKAIIYLKSSTGPRPFRTCYFSKKELARLLGDFAHYQESGLPKDGAYTEDLGTENEHLVFIEFGGVAYIKM